MSDAYLGTIILSAFDYAPDGWLVCHGQNLSNRQHQALYSLLGTRFGGDGNPNFSVPNLVGRAPVGFDPLSSPPNPTYPLGSTGGSERVKLGYSNLPAHNHAAVFKPVTGSLPVSVKAQDGGQSVAIELQASTATGVNQTPLANDWLSAGSTAGTKVYTASGTSTVKLKGASGSLSGPAKTPVLSGTVSDVVTGGSVEIATAGQSEAFDNRMPFLTLNFMLCINGIYPMRP